MVFETFGMKRNLTLATFGVGLLALVGGYFCPSPFFQAFLINISSSFLAIGSGLLIVNIYLERQARKGAVKSLLVLSNEAIAEFHNLWLDLIWAKMGSEGYDQTVQGYIKAGGKPEALKESARLDIYNAVNANKALQSAVDKLETTLTELSRLVGWDLDPRVLEASLDARLAIGRLKAVEMDDSAKSRDMVTENIIATDLYSGRARVLLMELAEVGEP